MTIENNEKVFKDVKYFLVEENDGVKQTLKDNGAQREYYITPLVNFIISDVCDFPQYEQAVELKIPIVKTSWVYTSIKCNALLPHQAFSTTKDVLFKDVCICPSQIPLSDRDPLLAMIVYHGGKFSTKLHNGCTHLVVGKPTGYEHAMKNQGKIKVVTVEWITKSIQLSKLLKEEEFEPIPQTTSFSSPLKVQSSEDNKKPATPTVLLTPTSQSSTSSKEQGHEVTSPVLINQSESSNTEGLLKGFVLLFSGYEERLLPETFAVWEEVIKKASGVIRDVYSPDVTHVICLHQQSPVFKKALSDHKKIATAYWLNDMLVAKRVFPPFTPLHLPVPFTDVMPGMKSSLITVSGYEGHDRILVKHMINFLGAQYTGHMTRAHTHLVCRSANGEKYKKAVEWGIPVVSPKWLGDMIQTGQSFPCKGKGKYAILGCTDELKINPTFSTSITDIWNESTNSADHINPGKRKHSLGESDGDGLQPDEKRRKLNASSTVKKVLFTGLTGATVHRLRQNVVKLKGELAKSVNECTHLVAPKITRTVKFLSAVSICKFLVAPAWVDESFEAKSFLDETNYTLVDPESEDLFGFKLKRSLQRAQTRQVCKGLHFHVTPSILPAPNAMKEIIECAGGKMTEVKTIEDVNTIFLTNVQQDFTYNSYLVSCMDDKKLWNDAVKDGFDVYNVELILSGVMKQELEWNLHHL